jgi:uncharacterized protein
LPEVGTLFALISGALVGFSLGLIGGGGSILATPLLLYAVGIPSPHVAIGTGALAVSVNAFASLLQHWRAGNVRWKSAVTFAAFGIAGAFLGSNLGKVVDGQRLLFFFSIVMIVVGVTMLQRKESLSTVGANHSDVTPVGFLRLGAVAVAVGILSGFFGIGGGFLIVPGLVFATGMPIVNAVGSSLFAVGAFGLTTAVNYAVSGLIDWKAAAEFVLGGVGGGYVGMRIACHLAPRRDSLNRVFAGLIFAVAAYMLFRTASAWR